MKDFTAPLLFTIDYIFSFLRIERRIKLEYKPSFSDSLRADIQPSYTDSLAHHGIKGMRWGVRRYQNTDGSLTSQGRKHYSLNPIKHIQSKWEENKRKAAEQKQLDDLAVQTAKVRTAIGHVNSQYADSKKEHAIWDAMDDYEDNPTQKRLDIVAKKAREYGYDYGEKAGKHLVNNYGNEAVNRYLDVATNTGTGSYPIPANRVSDSLSQLKTRNAAKRYAEYCAKLEELNAIDNVYEMV